MKNKKQKFCIFCHKMEYNVRYEYQGGETYEISQGKGKSEEHTYFVDMLFCNCVKYIRLLEGNWAGKSCWSL